VCEPLMAMPTAGGRWWRTGREAEAWLGKAVAVCRERLEIGRKW
jgi:hypothetical protein